MTRVVFRIFSRSAVLCLLVAASAATASAQSRSNPSQLAGYVFAAPLVRFTTYCTDFDAQAVQCAQSEWVRQDTVPHVGAAVEWQPVPSFGLATEAGVIFAGGGYRLGGLFAVNGTYYLRGPQGAHRSLVPFATGGYVIDTDREQGFNTGAGVSYRRAGGDAGVRLEVRGNFWEHSRTLELRLGVSFGGS